MNATATVSLFGVGGQGIILAAAILTETTSAQALEVKGMVQAQIYNVLNIQAAVRLKKPKAIQCSEGKAVRVAGRCTAL